MISRFRNTRLAAGPRPTTGVEFERALQITVAVLASLGTLVLGLGQQSVLLPAIAVFVAITSVYFTDIRGWPRLNRNVANVAAILAVLVSVSDFFRLERDSQLLAIANLLIYLQIVLMYQKKETHIYWQLMMLSLLQVVVAAALNFGLIFGWLLLAYLVVGLFALSLFYGYRERHKLLDLTVEGPSPWKRPRGRARRRSIEIVRQAVPAESELLDAGTGWSVVRQTLVTLAIATAVFLIVPRLGDEAWSQRSSRVQRVVGFDENVELGSLGTAFQDPSAVMRVCFTDPDTERPYPVQGEPLFRGSVLNQYEQGQWRYVRRSSFGEPLPAPLAPADARLVVQNVTLMPLSHDTIFAVAPAFRLDADDRTVRFNGRKEQLMRLAQYERSDFRLATLGLERGRQREITMLERPLEGLDELQLWQLPDAVGEPFPELARVARRVIEEQGVDSDDVLAKARALNAYLRDSGQFAYSLEGVPRDPALDPIEDFFANNSVGHCEYFSTALTLMLRTQRVPARMAIGFKGGEFNPVGNFYTVRQLHAHSWVEVYLEPEQVPAAVRRQHPRTNYGAWVTLDPTPSGEAALDEEVSLVEQFQQWRDYSEYLWSNYVVGLDARKQRDAIYGPIADGAKASAASFFSADAWSARWQRLRAWWTGGPWAWIKQNATNWKGALAGLLLVAALIGLGWSGRRLARRAAQWRQARRNSPEARRARTVEFYHRLESVLARQGIVREPYQTQQEFALSAGGRMADVPQLVPLASLPRKIVEAFYRVRFGGQPLTPEEEASIENALRQLSQAMAYRG
ncbi:MAG: DUF3488 and transglutaminase-like domain-containing protein [Pirellulales bacterium]